MLKLINHKCIIPSAAYTVKPSMIKHYSKLNIFPRTGDLIYGEVYRESVVVMRVLLIAAAVCMHFVLLVPLLNVTKKYKLLQICYIFQVLLLRYEVML